MTLFLKKDGSGRINQANRYTSLYMTFQETVHGKWVNTNRDSQYMILFKQRLLDKCINNTYVVAHPFCYFLEHVVVVLSCCINFLYVFFFLLLLYIVDFSCRLLLLLLWFVVVAGFYYILIAQRRGFTGIIL